jgi:2-polyprenyl-3-methyl-5-hydroxy-6-metoxy-1,4-benzoquinol methylase
MLLTLTTTRPPATDLGWLLHKHPSKVQTFDLAYGRAHVYYPEATDARCTVAMLLDVDPVGLVRRSRGPGGDGFALHQYVNDRPYTANSFLSVALAQVFGTALGGRCKDRPELVEEVLSLEARLAVLPCHGGADLLRRLFEPLGYEVVTQGFALDEMFADWGESRYFAVTLRGRARLQDLLTHLYVLIPVLDNEKHYWVGDEEVEKLLRRGEGWLAGHPERETIASRYLKHRRRLAREALARLAEEDHPDPDAETELFEHEETTLENLIVAGGEGAEPRAGTVGPLRPSGVAEPSTVEESGFSDAADAERAPTLNAQRLATVLAVLRGSGAIRVLDLGCGEGRLLRVLLEDSRFARIVGMDVSLRSLRIAAERLRLEEMPPARRQRIELLHGSLMYRDARLAGFDAATCIEVIEHLDPPRLAAFQRVLFEFARPQTVVITTPNREFNVKFETLPAGHLRHRDHRFEWTRAEFEAWARGVADRFHYTVRFLPVGPEDATVGPPTQLGIFERTVKE